MTRRLWAAVALLSVLMLGGCSVAVDSRIDEYQKTAEDLVTHVVQLIPSDLQPVQDAATDSRGVAPQNGVTAQKRPQDTARWEVRTYLALANRQDAASEAITAVTGSLAQEGWSSSRVRETDGGQTVTDGFRRDDWYLEISWSRSRPGAVERFDIFVVSPNTVRGDHDGLTS